MPGAVRRFGLMPALPLPNDELEAIATIIFYSDLEAPEWFEAYQKEEGKAMGAREELAARGKTYALQAKAVLGKNLMAAINANGTFRFGGSLTGLGSLTTRRIVCNY
jgi:hypothetical protein